MQDQREMMTGGIPENATDAERQALEREWDEMDRERDELIESWKEMYRRQGLDPEHVHLDWDAVFESEREE
ncbi:MAG TPA: hypothetical protein VMV29_01190 [Ktedonobacterales bacterium]|nr:hypothetical protein [Ktedonobacterales bacterium]